MLNIAVFASGRGSNFDAICGQIDNRKLKNAKICLVISDRESAPILQKADELGIPWRVFVRKRFDSDVSYNDALIGAMEEQGTNFVVLAGYLKMVGKPVLDRFRNQIINIHPALLPAFGGKNMYGMNVHRAVAEYGVKLTGATVHIVDEQYDHGPIVAQEAVGVEPGDTPEQIAARVLEVEHRLYPVVIGWFAEDRVTLQGRKVIVRD